MMNNIFQKKNQILTLDDINYVNINDFNILKYKTNCLIVDDYCILKFIFKYKYEILEKIDIFFIDLYFNTRCEPYLQLYYFLNKKIYYNYDKNNDYIILKKIITNPTITGLYNIDISCKFQKYDIKYQNDIINEICHIDINNILKANNDVYDFNFILKKIKLVWGSFLSYNIYNLPKSLLKKDNNVIEFYENLMKQLGSICICHPVNDKTTKFSNSRDIRFISNTNTNRFFSSNNRQPLHNDYAYYPEKISADWLILFSLQECEYGGYTSLITTKLITDILKKYNKKLFDDITNCTITYKYEDINIETTSKKKLLGKDNIINWNYFQIKNELNDNNVIKIKNDFFNFLEKTISEGQICTYKKKWNRGDAVLFNDHFLLHERSSFIGNRWLKDFAIKDTNLKLNIH